MAVGRGVGRGVGLGVGAGVGFGVGFGVGAGVGVGFGVGLGVGEGVGVGAGVIVIGVPEMLPVCHWLSRESNCGVQVPAGSVVETLNVTPRFQPSLPSRLTRSLVIPATVTRTKSGGSDHVSLYVTENVIMVAVVPPAGVAEGLDRVSTGLAAVVVGATASRTTSSATSDAPKTGRVTLREDPFAGRARDMPGASVSLERAAMVLGSPRPGRTAGAGAARHRPVVQSRPVE